MPKKEFMCTDIKYCILATPMSLEEYMCVKLKYIPLDIQIKYSQVDKVTHDDYVHIQIKRGMYGLKQAAMLAYDNLKTYLAPYIYSPIMGTVGAWEHNTRSKKVVSVFMIFELNIF